MSLTSRWARFLSAARMTSILEPNPTYGNLCRIYPEMMCEETDWCEEKLSPYTRSLRHHLQSPLINKKNKPSRTFTMFSLLPGIFKQPRKAKKKKERKKNHSTTNCSNPKKQQWYSRVSGSLLFDMGWNMMHKSEQDVSKLCCSSKTLLHLFSKGQ